MERFVVTRPREHLWLVSHDGQALAIYPTEGEALSFTFKRAAQRRREGVKTVVVITQAQEKGREPEA
ncbi:hypothetical protein [Microvirga aerophila]|uniref:Uncharacterized protein n=1 Tax=Microvirga aerophila TaxID=670291 RepID=A0A512C1Z7_9HYPH|nr:hypothetical protein [Microvirga aerophila]GEO18245.1 hypothetical protein MAE02_59410 [Microvirga aerophila]